jgi:hypothetical protein
MFDRPDEFGGRIIHQHAVVEAGAQQAAVERHVEGRPNPLVGYIPKQKDHFAIRQQEGIIEIAGDLARRAEAGIQVPAGERGQVGGQEVDLDAMPDLKFSLEAVQMGLLQVPQAFLFEGGTDPGAKQSLIKRLGR